MVAKKSVEKKSESKAQAARKPVMKKPANKSRGKAGELRKVRAELAEARKMIKTRDGAASEAAEEHRREFENISVVTDRLRAQVSCLQGQYQEARQALRAEEVHDREQELNISILLQRIMTQDRENKVLQAQIAQMQQHIQRQAQESDTGI